MIKPVNISLKHLLVQPFIISNKTCEERVILVVFICEISLCVFPQTEKYVKFKLFYVLSKSVLTWKKFLILGF